MGKTFGQLAYIRNIVYYRLSPYEQRAFAGWFENTFRGIKRDFFNNAPFIAPPMLGVYLLINWATKENERLSRKNPADYENDV